MSPVFLILALPASYHIEESETALLQYDPIRYFNFVINGTLCNLKMITEKYLYFVSCITYTQ
jgi:hypothetical protein